MISLKNAIYVCVGLFLSTIGFSHQVKINLLYFNDAYEIQRPKPGKLGGWPRMKTLIEKLRAQEPGKTLVFFGGDSFSPSIESEKYKGKQMIEVQNLLRLNASTLGNHDFDFGKEVLLERISEANFPYIVSNLTLKDGSMISPRVHPKMIYDFDGVKIGIFGILTRETELSFKGYRNSGFIFHDEIATAKKMVRTLRSDGADFIIALNHLPTELDYRTLKEVNGVDLVLGGHTHDHLAREIDGKYLVKMDSDLKHLAYLQISVDTESKQKSVSVQSIPVDGSYDENPEISAVVDRYTNEFCHLSEAICKTGVDLDARPTTVKNGESNFGNLVADVFRESLDADVALVNGGGIRAEELVLAGETLTVGDLKKMLPYNNSLVKVRMRVRTIKKALETVLGYPISDERRFLQISGFSMRYDISQPVGSRVVRLSRNGKLLPGSKLLTVVLDSYLLDGNDGHVYF